LLEGRFIEIKIPKQQERSFVEGNLKKRAQVTGNRIRFDLIRGFEEPILVLDVVWMITLVSILINCK